MLGEATILTRRLLLAAPFILSAAPSLAQTTRPLVVMMSADNCPPCNVWKKNDLPNWKQSRQFGMVDFKYIESRDIREVRNPSSWYLGKEYLPIYEEFTKNQSKLMVDDPHDPNSLAGAPRWFIVVDGKLTYVSVKWWRISTKLDDILNLPLF